MWMVSLFCARQPQLLKAKSPWREENDSPGQIASGCRSILLASLTRAGSLKFHHLWRLLQTGRLALPIFQPWDTHRLEVSDLPEDVYVKAAHFGPKDILGNSFPMSGPTTDRFEVVLSPKGGRVDGKVGNVVSGEDRPLPNAAVVLVPDAQLQRIDLYRMTTTDASGRFTIRGIAPGEYKAFAFENASDSYRAFEPIFASLSDSGGVSLHVVGGGSTTANVRVTP